MMPEKNFTKVETIGDGNCAFNAFALALCTQEILDGVELMFAGSGSNSNPLNEFYKKLVPSLASTAEEVKRKLLDLRRDQPQELQQKLAPFLRNLACDLRYPNSVKGEFIDILQAAYFNKKKPTKDHSSDDIFQPHKFIQDKFETLLTKHSQNRDDDAAEKNELSRWWNNEGFQSFVNEMRTDRIWAGDVELKALARHFKLNLEIYGGRFERLGSSEYGILTSEDFGSGDRQLVLDILVGEGVINHPSKEQKEFPILLPHEVTQNILQNKLFGVFDLEVREKIGECFQRKLPTICLQHSRQHWSALIEKTPVLEKTTTTTTPVDKPETPTTQNSVSEPRTTKGTIAVAVATNSSETSASLISGSAPKKNSQPTIISGARRVMPETVDFYIYGAVPQVLPTPQSITNQIYTRKPQKLEGNLLKTMFTKKGLPVMVPSGKSYQFSYEGGLPKTELPAESHQGDQKALGLTIINMIDNVVAKSETVSVNTHDPFVAEIAYRYLMNLKSKGINVEFVVQFKDQKFTSSTLYNDSINEILKTLPAVSFSTNSPEDSWEKEVKLEKRTKRVSEMLQKMKVEHDLDNNAGTPSSYNRP